MEYPSHYPAETQEWLTSALGKALLDQEQRIVEEALDGIFGEYCVQLGGWGQDHRFLRLARTQRTVLIDSGMTPATADDALVMGDFHRLPLADESVDCVLLPHTLDFTERPHAILREVHRVLRSDGYIVLLGFKTGGLWGIRRLIPGAGLPPASGSLISDRRLRDWLQLLDIRIHGSTRYFFRWPLPGNRRATSTTWEQRGQRWWPELAACYMLTAQKRVSTLTPVRPQWRSKPKVVAGLAGTTNRVSKISRIRFDPDCKNH
ncbi:MAG: class I SAM-dependent methyltransferase [Pseudomonadota bacterium]